MKMKTTIEEIVYNFLVDELEVPVYVMRPDDAPQKYVLIDRLSGGVDNRVPTASIALQSYGRTVFEASQLNEDVKTAMDQIVALNSIGRCKLTNDYMNTDLVRKLPRFQAVYDIRYYQDEIERNESENGEHCNECCSRQTEC